MLTAKWAAARALEADTPASRIVQLAEEADV